MAAMVVASHCWLSVVQLSSDESRCPHYWGSHPKARIPLNLTHSDSELNQGVKRRTYVICQCYVMCYDDISELNMQCIALLHAYTFPDISTNQWIDAFCFK
jgi:hypothetical protein